MYTFFKIKLMDLQKRYFLYLKKNIFTQVEDVETSIFSNNFIFLVIWT